MASLARSQNGWPVHPTSAGCVSLSWITGRVDPRVLDLFDRFCKRFNAEVESITRAHSWGYANREIRGSSQISNHASGTAIDLNAPAHPMGRRGTFTAKQEKAIRAILRDFPQITWGEDWSRPDGMHFEINVKPGGIVAVPRMASPAEGRFTSDYGPRNLKLAPWHAGIDIANSVGTPIYAAFAGKVEDAGWGIVKYRSGNGILIKNPDGERQYYGHLSRIRVKVGQSIARGERIGDMGATGNVTGPHLHFEAWANSSERSHYDPAKLFRKYGISIGSRLTAPDKRPPAGASPAPRDWFDTVDEKTMQKMLDKNADRAAELAVEKWLDRRLGIAGSLQNHLGGKKTANLQSLSLYSATSFSDGRTFYQRLMTRLAAIEANQKGGITAADVAKALAPQLLDGLGDLIAGAIEAAPDRDAEQIAEAVVTEFTARLAQED